MPKTEKLCLLFDLDGTLTDSDHLHLEAFNALLGEFGRSISRADYTRNIMGADNASICRYLFPNLPLAESLPLADRKEVMFRDMLAGLKPTAGLGALLDWADARALPMAIVTNAPRANADLMIAALGLQARIPALVIGPELAHAKPHPLPYLTGLERLGGQAGRALAFEDSRSGLRAAVDAGITAVGLTTSLGSGDILGAGAALAITDFSDARLWALLESMSAPAVIAKQPAALPEPVASPPTF